MTWHGLCLLYYVVVNFAFWFEPTCWKGGKLQKGDGMDREENERGRREDIENHCRTTRLLEKKSREAEKEK
jgi:hypothetical protein